MCKIFQYVIWNFLLKTILFFTLKNFLRKLCCVFLFTNLQINLGIARLILAGKDVDSIVDLEDFSLSVEEIQVKKKKYK